jgi:hypothetical protein
MAIANGPKGRGNGRLRALRERAARRLVVLALVLMPCLYWVPAGQAQTAQPLRFPIAVKARQVEPALRVVRAKQGDSVELAFSSDEPVELHLHGYDLSLRVEPDKPAVMKFQAKLAGRFPIEAHASAAPGTPERGAKRRHLTLLYLEVYPR